MTTAFGISLLKTLQTPTKMVSKELTRSPLSYSLLYQRMQKGMTIGEAENKSNRQERLTPQFKAAIVEEMKTQTHRQIAKKHKIGLDTLTKIRKEYK